MGDPGPLEIVHLTHQLPAQLALGIHRGGEWIERGADADIVVRGLNQHRCLGHLRDRVVKAELEVETVRVAGLGEDFLRGFGIVFVNPELVRVVREDRRRDALDKVALAEIDLFVNLVVWRGVGHGLPHLGFSHDRVGLHRADIGNEVGLGADNLHRRILGQCLRAALGQSHRIVYRASVEQCGSGRRVGHDADQDPLDRWYRLKVLVAHQF